MTKHELQSLLRELPSVDQLLQLDSIQKVLEKHPRSLVLKGIRQVIEGKRSALLDRGVEGAGVDLNRDHLAAQCIEQIELLGRHTLRPVVNATGIVIHTNLGRSLLPADAVTRLNEICRGYNNLEYDLRQGRRGSRYVHAEEILCEITGADSALVVNNNAAAVFLALSTLAKGREVIVSRGQMVEIGGSFRIPDVMTSGGAVLREIGCTNRTHLRDYENAINEKTALLLKVHCSNYRVMGFTTEVSLRDLVELSHKYELPVMEDLGSGSFVDMSAFGLDREPTAQEAVAAGADVVTFSGDKLLGGPQAGILLGKDDIIHACKKNPLTRALRVDKMTLAALESTLRLYRDERLAIERIPTLKMIAAPLDVLKNRAETLATRLTTLMPETGFSIAPIESVSQVGGGSLPAQDLPTYAVAVTSSHMSAARIEKSLRNNTPPIIGRIELEQFLMDMRTLQEGDFELIEGAFARLADK